MVVPQGQSVLEETSFSTTSQFFVSLYFFMLWYWYGILIFLSLWFHIIFIYTMNDVIFYSMNEVHMI